jgi:hypothetical protein
MTAAFALSGETLTLIALVALGLSALALAFAVIGPPGGRGLREPAEAIRLDDAIRGILHGQSQQIKRLEGAIRSLSRTDKRQEGEIRGSVRNVALLRYDAFEDVGGRLSFSCALLDDHGTGVVLTSIHGRQETRVYAKPVTAGRSQYNLSDEEEEAIRRALAEPEEAVGTRR